MKVLLVWNEVPEKLRFFGIDNPSDEQLKVLTLANNLYVNCCSPDEEHDDALQHTNAALTAPQYADGYKSKDAPKIRDGWVSSWHDREIAADTLPLFGSFDQVFSSGFIM